jgi:NitT/TauT family transport system substrate-binding protein
VKVGMFPYSSYLPFYIAQQEGYYTEQGITVEFVPFTSIVDGYAALAQGQIDVMGGTADISSLNIIAQHTGVMVVADKGYIDPAGCPYSAWVVQNDILSSGKLDNLANLAGMKATFTKASVFEYALDLLLKPAALTSTNLNVTDVPAPTRLEGLVNGSFDIAQMGEPWVTRALNTGKVSIWKTFNSYMPDFQFGVMFYGPTFTKQNQEAGRRFMVAYLKAVRQYNEGKTDRNVALMVAMTQGTEEETQQSCWLPIRSDGSINVQSILDIQQWGVEKGYLDKTLSVSEFWDPQYVDYANGALK